MQSNHFLFDRLGRSPRRIAILRALGGLGDFLCAVPALRSLRAALPDSEIILIGLPSVAALVERFSHYLNGLLEFPGYPGLPERPLQLHTLPAFLELAQQQSFDLAIQMHGSGVITNPLTVLLGAQITAGFFLPGHYCPDPGFFLPYVQQESEVRRYLTLMQGLGIPPQGEELEFPLYEQDHTALQAITAAYGLARNYVCIHPGASVSARRWPPEQFAAVADWLADRGFQIVLTGSAAETELTQTVATAMHAPSLNLAGRTSLGAIAALLSRSRLLICNDTGVSHLAAALQTPSVVIFSDSDPERWAPLDRDRHRVVCAAPELTAHPVITQAERLLDKVDAYVTA